MSCFSDTMREIIADGRVDSVLELVGRNARIREEEKDGTVVNRDMNARGSLYKADPVVEIEKRENKK